MSAKRAEYVVDGKLIYVEVGGEVILVQGGPDEWTWRGATWTSHITSVGPYRTQEEAIEAARKVVEQAQVRPQPS